MTGYLGEKEPFKSKRVIVVKTHDPLLDEIEEIQDDTPVILLIRQPQRYQHKQKTIKTLYI